MNKFTALIERFMSVLPMIVSSKPGKEVECKSHLDCFALLAMTRIFGVVYKTKYVIIVSNPFKF